MKIAQDIKIIGVEPNAKGKLVRHAKKAGFPIMNITTEELIAIWLNTNAQPLPEGIAVEVRNATERASTSALHDQEQAPQPLPLPATVDTNALDQEIARLTAQLAVALPLVPAPTDTKATATIEHKSARDVFDTDLDLTIPVFTWTPANPLAVPVIDPAYAFRPELLARVLLALATNQRAYFFGHTGTGKTTLIEQVAARLNWPVSRVNLDVEIGRLELLGKEALKEEKGATVSSFLDGVIPTAMENGHILLTDEIDSGAAEAMFILQSVAEGRALNLLEDNRTIEPHAMFRFLATANTNGQGDESGHYPGTKVLNSAFLNRFTIWGEVPYMDAAQEASVLVRNGVPAAFAKELADYGRLHREAFVQAEVMQPLSLRGLLAMATNAAFVGRELAYQTTILDSASKEDRAVLEALYMRTLA